MRTSYQNLIEKDTSSRGKARTYANPVEVRKAKSRGTGGGKKK